MSFSDIQIHDRRALFSLARVNSWSPILLNPPTIPDYDGDLDERYGKIACIIDVEGRR